jgi:integrase
MMLMPQSTTPGTSKRAEWRKSESGCWSCSIGKRSRRVRIFQRKAGGQFYRDVWIAGKGKSRASMGTKSRTEARALAEAFLRGIQEALDCDDAQPSQARAPLTLGELCNRYREEAPAYRKNKPRTRSDKNARAELLCAGIGRDIPVEYLTLADVERYSEIRTLGTGWPDGRATAPARARSVAADLQLLRTMIRWATTVRLPDFSWLLKENPLRGLKLPSEPDPRRPVATYDRFELVLDATLELASVAEEKIRTQWIRLGLALVLAEATGRRIGAIAALRWEDFEQDPPAIRWRAENDKRRREALIPMPDGLASEVRRIQVRLGNAEDGWCFPNRRGGHWTKDILSQLLIKAEAHAQVPKLEGGLWHPYRRKWATERKTLPDADVMTAGGWKDLATLKASYQQTDEETLLAVAGSTVKLMSRKSPGKQ